MHLGHALGRGRQMLRLVPRDARGSGRGRASRRAACRRCDGCAPRRSDAPKRRSCGRGPLVEPERAGPQRPAASRRTARRSRAGWRWRRRRCARGRCCRSSCLQGRGGRASTSRRVLLEPAGLRIGHGDRRAALGHGPALAVPGDRLGRRGRGVDADDEIAGHVARLKKIRRQRSTLPPPVPGRLLEAGVGDALSIRLATLSMHFLASPP